MMSFIFPCSNAARILTAVMMSSGKSTVVLMLMII